MFPIIYEFEQHFLYSILYFRKFTKLMYPQTQNVHGRWLGKRVMVHLEPGEAAGQWKGINYWEPQWHGWISKRKRRMAEARCKRAWTAWSRLQESPAWSNESTGSESRSVLSWLGDQGSALTGKHRHGDRNVLILIILVVMQVCNCVKTHWAMCSELV